MNTKIAFFDIDGTLVNVPNGMLHPTDETIRVLNEFKNQGNKIVIATARGEVPESVANIEFDGYICNDGHYIRFNNEILIDEQFDNGMVQKQLDVYAKYNGRSMFNGRGGAWCSFLDDELVIKHRAMFQGTTERPTDVNEVFKTSDVKAVSCCVLFDSAAQLWAAYHELEDEFTMIPYDTGLIRMDVYCKGFTKGTACEYLYQN
ncbi:MAG: HAD hydrolase family protein [Thomasclavelia ramosa]